MQTKNCLHCGKNFPKPPTESREVWLLKHKFCSQACHYKCKIGREVSPETRIKLSVTSRGRKHRPESIAKMSGVNAHRWKGGLPKCPQCNDSMQNRYAETCRKCYQKNNEGIKSPHWQGGKTPIHTKIRNSKDYRSWRLAIFERDNYTCIWCGARSAKGVKVILNADHIKSFALHPKLRLNIDNGRTLCKSCHEKTDAYRAKSTKQLKIVV